MVVAAIGGVWNTRQFNETMLEPYEAEYCFLVAASSVNR
jgi:hypothetical protein